MIYIIPIFIAIPLILMGIMILIPIKIGKKTPPAFTNEKSEVFDISKEELYQLIINYENYPIWIKYISFVETQKLDNNKIKIMQTYKKKNIYQEYYELKRIENEKISILKLENEYTVLWSYILTSIENNKTKLTIKETMYVYHPYLKFMLKYILKDENAKKDFFKQIRKKIKNDK